MDQLSGLDASFLSLETDNAPMQIGGLSFLAAETPYGRLDFERFRALIGSRLDTGRTFRQKLAFLPLNLGRPYWVDDPDFDLDRHVERTRLPEPGGLRELSALMAYELEQQLPRDRPLWKFLFVEGLGDIAGLPGAAFAVISLVHHAAIDGVSGSELLAAIFDPSPEPVERPASRPRRDAKPTGRLARIARAGRELLDTPDALKRRFGQTLLGVAKVGVASLRRLTPPPMLFTAPRTRFNVTVSRRRSWSAALLSLTRIRKIKEQADCTVNDVVLTVCAGALRRYLDERGELPEKSLIAMVPISVRAEDERGAMGNQVSAMLVSLATDLEGPLARLRKVRQGARDSKIYHQAIGATTLADYTEFIPFSLAGLGARLYTGLHLAERHNPLFNLVITNVPGPRVPLYVAGARLLAHCGAAPIFDGMGLILPVFSYADTLSIGVVSSPEILPDPWVFSQGLKDALDELEAAVESRRKPTGRRQPAERKEQPDAESP